MGPRRWAISEQSRLTLAQRAPAVLCRGPALQEAPQVSISWRGGPHLILYSELILHGWALGHRQGHEFQSQRMKPNGLWPPLLFHLKRWVCEPVLTQGVGPACEALPTT